MGHLKDNGFFLTRLYSSLSVSKNERLFSPGLVRGMLFQSVGLHSEYKQ